ncbi:primase-like protein [Aquimarina sp. MAR_2010_214]|uniref:BT4734/BF3469 family protein n=1 Tax=Aquimarina sp. MAR_2010_214 TaxID=1250026 RepID=UPI000C70146C|nr:BT4734/BF3469 family protein [Aquimarina sp. MAR_2010_214]PKV52819.1 primase-like protein [Aquimarina sp. MAR_2010_214]
MKNIKVSYQENTWSKISKEITIGQTLNIINSELLQNKIRRLRKELKNGNKDYYNNHKKSLPAVTFSATFQENRRKDKLKHYNQILVIDIDKLTTEEMTEVGKTLKQEPFVFSFWKSPSNKGYKGLIKLSFIEKFEKNNTDFQHKNAFNLVSNYFLETHNIELDKSGSDITRLCFLSYDQKIINKENFQEFKIENSNIPEQTKKKKENNSVIKFSSNKDALYNSKNRNDPYDRRLMSNIIRYLNNKNHTITESYENWCKVAMAMANTFTFDVGKNYFLKLSKRDSDKFNEINCINFLKNCYENRKGEVSFASIVFLANNKGFKTKYQKDNGVPKAEGFTSSEYHSHKR